MTTGELPGKKKTAGISEKRACSFFRKSPPFSPVRLRTGGPAKPACPEAACFRSPCCCGTPLENVAAHHPQPAGFGEGHPPRRGTGQRPGVPSCPHQESGSIVISLWTSRMSRLAPGSAGQASRPSPFFRGRRCTCRCGTDCPALSPLACSRLIPSKPQ